MSLLDDILATKLQEVTQTPEVRALKAQVQELQARLASKSRDPRYTTHHGRPWGPSGPTEPLVSIEERRDPLTMDRQVTARVMMTVGDLEYYKGQNIEFLVQELSGRLASILLNSQPSRITGTTYTGAL